MSICRLQTRTARVRETHRPSLGPGWVRPPFWSRDPVSDRAASSGVLRLRVADVELRGHDLCDRVCLSEVEIEHAGAVPDRLDPLGGNVDVTLPQLGVHVDLRDAEPDGAAQILVREPGRAVQGERDRGHGPDRLEAWPVERRGLAVNAVHVADRDREAGGT